MNLMPPIPPGRRYFRFGIAVILLWLLHLSAFSAWLWTEQSEAAARLEKESKKAIIEQLEALKEVKEHEAFMAKYGPSIRYRDAVKELGENRAAWSEALAAVKEALPAGGKLFQAEAEERRFDGWAVFPSAAEAAAFLEELKKDPRVEGAFLDCLGPNCAEKPPLKEAGEGAQAAHFHFTLKDVPAADDAETDEGGTDAETPADETEPDNTTDSENDADGDTANPDKGTPADRDGEGRERTDG